MVRRILEIGFLILLACFLAWVVLQTPAFAGGNLDGY